MFVRFFERSLVIKIIIDKIKDTKPINGFVLVVIVSLKIVEVSEGFGVNEVFKKEA